MRVNLPLGVLQCGEDRGAACTVNGVRKPSIVKTHWAVHDCPSTNLAPVCGALAGHDCVQGHLPGLHGLSMGDYVFWSGPLYLGSPKEITS